jgi:hypothetical protein
MSTNTDVSGALTTPSGRLSDGAESNLSGQFLEHIVKAEAERRGFLVVDYAHELDNGDLFTQALLIRNVPYQSIYGSASRSEFVLQYFGRRIRVECRVQEVSGSVDEKFPYFYMNACEAMPEREIVLIHHGEGARPMALNWLRRRCARTTAKTIHVFTISEYRRWFKNLIANGATQ